MFVTAGATRSKQTMVVARKFAIPGDPAHDVGKDLIIRFNLDSRDELRLERVFECLRDKRGEVQQECDRGGSCGRGEEALYEACHEATGQETITAW